MRVELLEPPDVRRADVLVGVAAERQAERGAARTAPTRSSPRRSSRRRCRAGSAAGDRAPDVARGRGIVGGHGGRRVQRAPEAGRRRARLDDRDIDAERATSCAIVSQKPSMPHLDAW